MTEINLPMLGVAYRGLNLPLLCSASPMAGNSNTAERWIIESQFAALKTHGSYLEDAQFVQPEPIENLLGLLTLDSNWVIHTCLWAHAQQPIREKTLQRRQFNFSRCGLDLLQRLVANCKQFGTQLPYMPGCLLDGQPLEFLPPRCRL